MVQPQAPSGHGPGGGAPGLGRGERHPARVVGDWAPGLLAGALRRGHRPAPVEHTDLQLHDPEAGRHLGAGDHVARPAAGAVTAPDLDRLPPGRADRAVRPGAVHRRGLVRRIAARDDPSGLDIEAS